MMSNNDYEMSPLINRILLSVTLIKVKIKIMVATTFTIIKSDMNDNDNNDKSSNDSSSNTYNSDSYKL